MSVLCVLCALYRPQSKPRQPTVPQACDGCRERLSGELSGLPEAYMAVGGNLEHGRTGGERRATGFESQAPLNVHAVSLIAPGSVIPATDGRPYPQDQLGDVPPLEQLAWWVEDWIGTRARREPMPALSIPFVVVWLKVRLEWACNDHPAIDEFAADIHRIAWALKPHDSDRGEKVGKCPRKNGDSVCGTALYVDPYTDRIRCTRCGQEWRRRNGEWLHLRAQQIAAGTDAA